jgi:hypothetical protein
MMAGSLRFPEFVFLPPSPDYNHPPTPRGIFFGRADGGGFLALRLKDCTSISEERG